MVETTRSRNAYDDAATGARAYGASARRPYSVESPDLGRERSDRQQGDFLDDAIPLVGILVGGALGYLAANAFGGGSSRDTGRSAAQGQAAYRPSGSPDVEHDETTDMIASSKVEGTAVYNRQGEKLGEVYNFMVGKRSGRVAYAVMSFGGFLGIGQKYHAVPWNALTYDKQKGGYVVDADRDRLMAAPTYGADEDPFARPGYGREVETYWASGLI